MTFDDRTQFFLRHRPQIEEWASLADDARTATETLLFAIVKDLDEWANNQIPPLEVSLQRETNWPKILIHRHAWLLAAPVPEIGIGIEWVRPSLDLAHDTRCPYVGVRVCYDKLDGPARSRDLKKRFHDAKLLTGGMRSNDYFPLLRSVPATNAYWQDSTPYCTSLIDTVQSIWRTTESIITESLAKFPLLPVTP
jgi:hypothetical protein